MKVSCNRLVNVSIAKNDINLINTVKIISKLFKTRSTFN